MRITPVLELIGENDYQIMTSKYTLTVIIYDGYLCHIIVQGDTRRRVSNGQCHSKGLIPLKQIIISDRDISTMFTRRVSRDGNA